VSLRDTTGATAAHDITSPKSIPEYDTSAMDGYAIHSHTTANASPVTPVLFRVQGSLAAGDDPRSISWPTPNTVDEMELNSCVEIMTGAIFPDRASTGKPYDACVRVEDAKIVDTPLHGGGRTIAVSHPVTPGVNKRLAGNDIREGDVMVRKGQVIRPAHILALAAVGIQSIPVVPKLRVAIVSTGRELINGKGATKDANGPYLTVAIREMGADADFVGIIGDDPTALQDHVQNLVDSGLYDLILTSGAVSKGRFDHVRAVLDKTKAEIIFHGLAIRPGHPVLFALLPEKKGRRIPLFGLPGNPGAAAACFRLLTVPYLRAVQGQPMEQPIRAVLQSECARKTTHPPPGTDWFRHGTLSASSTGQLTVHPTPEQSPAKLGPFLSANCWI
ncbi:hypothetical protein N656DRAFT_693226, partial [Canariomyces notabilis]